MPFSVARQSTPVFNGQPPWQHLFLRRILMLARATTPTTDPLANVAANPPAKMATAARGTAFTMAFLFYYSRRAAAAAFCPFSCRQDDVAGRSAFRVARGH